MRQKYCKIPYCVVIQLAVCLVELLKSMLCKKRKERQKKSETKLFLTQLSKRKLIQKKHIQPEFLNSYSLLHQNLAVCGLDCGPHGQCLGSSCVCSPEWQGPRCNLKACNQRCQVMKFLYVGYWQCWKYGLMYPNLVQN